MIKSFGSTKEVFVNQDEGMFVALPITLDENVLTLETEVEGGRKYVLAGSVVLEGSSVRGILAEPYDITDGPVVGRVVLEGYCWANRLTPSALAAKASLPRVVTLPYKVIHYELLSEDTSAHKAVIKIKCGLKFASTIAAKDLTVSTLTVSTLSVSSDGTELTITFTAGGEGALTAVDVSKIEGADVGSVVKDLPIDLSV